MLDKAAITKAAQKFIAKGQIDLAIAEWEKLLAGRKDGNIYNTIGDLYLRKKAKKEAIESFKKAAEIFKEDGFILKAIALYKKILSISSSDVDVLIAIGELHAEKGLIGDAVENFLAAAEIYSKEGATDKALELYQKTLQLAPQNINLKFKIAELYLKTGLSGEAVRQYIDIASEYLARGKTDKAQEFYLKAIDIDSDNVLSLIGLSQIAEKQDDTKQAFEYLKKAMSFAPDNKDVLINYSRLAFKTDNINDAKETLSRLLEIDPSHMEAKKLLGNIYLKEGSLEEAWAELMPCIDDALYAKEWNKALECLENFKELYPIEVKRRLVSAYKGKGDKEAAISELKELVKLYEDKGQDNEALLCYKDIHGLKPDDEATIDRIRELEEKLGLVSSLLEEEAEVEVITEPSEPAEAVEEAVEAVSPENFETRKNEADFYAQYGFKEQAIKIYESLLRVSPGNKEIEEKLKALRLGVEPEAKPVEEKPAEETPPEKVSIQASADSSLQDVLKDFKKGIEKEIGEKDPETHYNLGIAYKEMGLLEDAVREFQVAAKDHSKTRQSLIMIALCHMQKGLYASAINELKKVMASMSPGDEGYIEVQYDLAEAYVKNKEYDNALRLFIEIRTQDAGFRDVAKKIEIVKDLILQGQDKPKTKKDRVSYL